MAEGSTVVPSQQRRTQESIDRRGLFARAAALAGVGVAWFMGSERAEATHGGGTDTTAVHTNQNNLATERTFLTRDGGQPLFVAFNGPSAFSYGGSDALQAHTNKGSAGIAVRAVNAGASGGIGVLGSATTAGTGVVGTSNLGGFFSNPPPSVGVLGQTNAQEGVGVRGQIPTNGPVTATAVYGENLSSNGTAWTAFGCYGYSAKGHGLLGATGIAGGSAMVGTTNGVAGAYSGLFYGPMVITGDLAVVGAKSAAVAHPDGSHRLLYCVESPESWFEDFGKGLLTDGEATVTLDPAFTALSDMTDYHVFVTVYDQHDELMVSDRTGASFRVSARDCTSNSSFSWRVVAKRKDIAGTRLAKVTIPAEQRIVMPRVDETPRPERREPPPPSPAPHKHETPHRGKH